MSNQHLILFTFVVLCYISLITSVHATDCQYLYVSPDSFAYSGWYEYINHAKKFGSNYFHFMDNPQIIQLLIYDNKWYFYNWQNKDDSYTLSSTETASIHSVSSTNHSTWNSMADGSQIQLTLQCSTELNALIGSIPYHPKSTLTNHDEQLHWMINKQNCHDKPRRYVGMTKTNAYWNIPILSNHTSDVTVSISGDTQPFELGHHKITYAAENTQYFIMCQITLYIIDTGDVSELTQCTSLPYGRIGIIELVVDEDTFLVINTDKYEYQLSDDNTNPIQVLYVTPDLIDRDITCYININWGNIGNIISYSLSSNDFGVWKVLIIVCIILTFGVIMERIYFYRIIYKSKYNSVSNNDGDLSFNDDDIQIPMSTFEQTVDINGSRRGMQSNNRAMSMQINSYPFITAPTIGGDNRRNHRYYSVPTNLMTQNVMKQRIEYDNVDFWKKELRAMKEAGFMNKKHNLSMLVKYVVKNEHHLVDKKMTESVVIRILQKEKKENKVNDEMENFLQNEWDDEDESICITPARDGNDNSVCV